MNALLLYNEAGNINKNNMSVHKLVQMCLRGLSLCLLMICLYYTSESEDIAGSLTFLLCGVYGGYAVVTFGLLLEAGLMQKSDKCVEALFLLCAIILNTMCVVVALYQYYTATTFRRERMMNKGIISILLVVLFSVDLSVLCWWDWYRRMHHSFIFNKYLQEHYESGFRFTYWNISIKDFFRSAARGT